VDDELPASVRRQLSEEDGNIVFKGWIRPNQIEDLKGYNSTLKWLCAIENLEKTAQPPESLKGKVSYLVDHESLAFAGNMRDRQKDALLQMQGGNEDWAAAVEDLSKKSHRTVTVTALAPAGFRIPDELRNTETVTYDREDNSLAFTGPMSPDDRDLLIHQFPIVIPLIGDERENLRKEIESRGEAFNEAQAEDFNKVLDGLWTVEQLVAAINTGGVYEAPEKTACELLEEQGKDPIPTEAGEDVELTARQVAFLNEFANGRFSAEASRLTHTTALTALLNAIGALTPGQESALEKFLSTQPTLGQRNESLYFALLKRGPVSAEQKAFLLADIQAETEWQNAIVQPLRNELKHVPVFVSSNGGRNCGIEMISSTRRGSDPES
jgi:hypothetical protein